MTAVLLRRDLRREPAPARSMESRSTPVVLTAQPLLQRRADLAACLRDVPFDLRTVAQWDRLPEGIERIRADVVLVDMDAAGGTSDGVASMSGHRLMKLLKRRLKDHPTALVVITRLDFAEIQDLVRAGIHALVRPEVSSKALVRQICAVVSRLRQGDGGGHHRRTAQPPASDGGESGHAMRSQPEQRRVLTIPDLRGVWGIPDSLWHAIEPHMPHRSEGSRERISDRVVLEGLLRLELSGCGWAAIPATYGSPATIRRRARMWAEAGIFGRLALLTLEAEGELPLMPWEELQRRFAPAETREG